MNQEFIMTVAAECCLQGASRSLREALKRHLTIDNPKYRDAKKYGRWVGKRIKPRLYFFVEDQNSFWFPRGFARQAIGLCRQHMGQSPKIIDKRMVLPEKDFRFHGQLRPYQVEAIKDVLQTHFGVLVAGTGSGKTVMALSIIAARRQPTLVLLHNKELMYQWRDRVLEFLKMDAGLIGDGHFDIRPVTIAIVNTARKHLTELPGCFGHLVVDECHRVPASLFTEVVKSFDSRYMLGLSATAYRREDGLTRLIYFYMGDRSHQADPEKLTSSGAILKPEFIQRYTDFNYGFRGDYQALLKALTRDDNRNHMIVSDIKAAVKSEAGTILVVSDRVAHCEKLGAHLSTLGIKTRILTGRLSAEKRAEIVELVHQRQIKVLISTLQLVGEGFDADGLTTLFLTTPIKFSGRLRQVVGRILRPATDKQPKVVDYIDHKIGVLRASARQRQRTYVNLATTEED